MKRWLCLFLILVLAGCLCLSGCQRDDPTPAENDPDWSPSAPEQRDLSALLTAEEVSEAVGKTVNAGVLQDGGAALSFATEDYALQVVLLVEQPKEAATDYFAAITENYEEGSLSPAPNLGQSAYWCGSTGELLVCADKEVFSLNIVCDTMGEETRLIAARQLAVLVLGRL